MYKHCYSLSSIATPVHGMAIYTTRDHGQATITLSDGNQVAVPIKQCMDGYPVMLSTELTKSVTSLFSAKDIWVDKDRIQLGKLIREGNKHMDLYGLHVHTRTHRHRCTYTDTHTL